MAALAHAILSAQPHRRSSIPALADNLVQPYRRGYHVLGIPVLGIPHIDRMAKQNGDHGVGGYYMPKEKAIALQRSDVRVMRNWRKADPWSVSFAIADLGHEFEHYRQQRAGLPFNEKQAEQWSKNHFNWLKGRLGINRPLPNTWKYNW